MPFLTPSKKRRAGSKKRDIDYDHELALSLHPDSAKDMAKSPYQEVMATLQQVTNLHRAQQEAADPETESNEDLASAEESESEEQSEVSS